MFLSLPWPKTPLFTVCLNLLSKSTAICDVFNNMVAQNTAICEVFTFLRKELKPRQCTKTLQKTIFLPNKNDENRHPNSSEITKFGPPPSRQDTWKNTRLKAKNRRPTVKKTTITVLLPVPGGCVHGLAHSVLKNTMFVEVRRRDLSTTHGFGQKLGPPPR